MAEPTIKRLGTFLADLTQDKPPDQIHQEVLDRLRDPGQDLDHRLAGIYLHVKDFVPIWTAIRNGVSLPAASWETVVLPVVVHFSSPQNLKPHLETVTSMFLTARGAREIEADPVPAPVYDPEPMSLLDSVFDDNVDAEPPAAGRPAPVAVAARTGRRWVPQAAAVTIVAVAAVAIWTGGGRIGPGGTNLFSALPERPSVTVPSTEPSASPSPEPLASGSPTPAPGPTSAAPGAPPPGQPSRIPGAPTGLSASSIDRSSVTLAWRPPANAVNVAYYKIFQNGAVIGQPTATTDDALNLKPATTYTFVVRAYNQAGQESPPSNSLAVTTTTPPLVFDVPNSVAFGSSFGVSGSGWLCPEVKIFIAGHHVELGKVDEYNTFDAQIKVHEEHGEPGWVDILNSGGAMYLAPGDWSMTASCPGGPSKSATISVIGEPMMEPTAQPKG